MKSKFVYGFILATSLSFNLAMAGAPMAKTPQAGFQRLMVGAFEVTALSDGTADLPMDKLLSNVTPAEYKKAKANAFLPDVFETSVNGFLINTGTHLVLVDTGAGNLFGPTTGKLLASLKNAGYKPEQVDAVLITHMHADHVGGLMVDGKMAFPNANVYADQAESDYWLSEDNLAKAPEANKAFFQNAMASLSAYKKAGKLKAIPADYKIVPGITAKSTFGHTKGHTSYMVESNGIKLMLIGDLVHMAAVQLGKPTVAIAFDTDSKAAVAKRIEIFTEAAKNGYMIGVSHFSFPGLGHLQANKKAFTFVPINYTR